VLFSVDCRYEGPAASGRVLNQAAVDDTVRAKVARLNAASVMNFQLEPRL
jgi:hypothetical protein